VVQPLFRRLDPGLEPTRAACGEQHHRDPTA
jgi:hypothetical protein